jgi:hypothetical protein
MVEDGDRGSQQPLIPPQVPAREALSYNAEDIGLTRTPIDWDLLDPKTKEGLSPEEAAERDRRITSALLGLASEIDERLQHKPGEMKLHEVVNRLLNPDRYQLTDEDPEVGPPEELSRN